MLAFYSLAVMCGALGTFYAFRSYSVCGNNKLLAVLIAYCVPVLVMMVLARVWLQARIIARAGERCRDVAGCARVAQAYTRPRIRY